VALVAILSFDWKVKKQTPEPLFEGIMISTSGSHGLSFTTQGKRIVIKHVGI